MSKMDEVLRLMSEVGNTPVTNRRQGLSDRRMSWWRRGVALGFLLGLATSVGLWLYDRWSARTELPA
jgi:hypothetical protein